MDPGILITVLLVILVVAIVSTMWTAARGAPWAPTPWAVVCKMLRMAGTQPGEVVYDLGSGDGRVLVVAARRFKARAIGIEIDPLRYLWTQLFITVLGVRAQVRIIRGDLFTQDLSQADVVTVYLRQDTNRRLVTKLRGELRPGARVVSYSFTLPGWTPTAVDELSQIFVYRVREGRHDGATGA